MLPFSAVNVKVIYCSPGIFSKPPLFSVFDHLKEAHNPIPPPISCLNTTFVTGLPYKSQKSLWNRNTWVPGSIRYGFGGDTVMWFKRVKLQLETVLLTQRWWFP